MYIRTYLYLNMSDDDANKYIYWECTLETESGIELMGIEWVTQIEIRKRNKKKEGERDQLE